MAVAGRDAFSCAARLEVRVTTVPDSLRRGLEREIAGTDRTLLREATQRLMATYQQERPAGTPIVRNALDAKAYAAYRMPATYAAAKHVFEQVNEVLAPSSLLDLGGGSGAAAWAAVDAFPTLTSVAVVDQSPHVISLGQSLREGVAGSGWTWVSAAASAPIADVDLAVLGYVVGELSPAHRAALIARLVIAANAVAVLEPGTPTGFARILEVREQLIAAGWHIAAPCPHEDECPWAGEGRDWCHMSARIQRLPLQRELKGGVVGHEDEKVAYVVATRDPVARPSGRVVRHPMTRKGMVELQVCQSSGDVAPVTITKRHGEAYRAARNTDWGDPWPAT